MPALPRGRRSGIPQSIIGKVFGQDKFKGSLDIIARQQDDFRFKATGDWPAKLYPPLSTRNDWNQYPGYDEINPVQPLTGLLGVPVGFGVTESKNASVPTYSQDSAGNGVRGTKFIPESGPTRFARNDYVQPYPIDRIPMQGVPKLRPRGTYAPYVRSWLTDEKRRVAVDYNLRGNLAFNEWFRNLPEVYERGNGYAVSGPAYPSSQVNVDTF